MQEREFLRNSNWKYMYKRQSTSGVFTNSSDTTCRYSILAARDWLEFSFTTFSKHFSSRPDWECSFYLLCTQQEISNESNNSYESLYIRFSGALPAFFLHNTEMIYISLWVWLRTCIPPLGIQTWNCPPANHVFRMQVSHN